MADPSSKGSQLLVADGCGTQGLSQVGVQGCHPVGSEEADMQEKGIQGLGDVIIATDSQTSDLVAGVIAGGKEKNGEVAACGAQLTGDGETIHVREHDIKDREIRFVCFYGCKCLATIGGCNNLEASEAQRSGEKFADIWFVVNYKKFCFSRFCTHELQFAQEVWELAERELILFFRCCVV